MQMAVTRPSTLCPLSLRVPRGQGQSQQDWFRVTSAACLVTFSRSQGDMEMWVQPRGQIWTAMSCRDRGQAAALCLPTLLAVGHSPVAHAVSM